MTRYVVNATMSFPAWVVVEADTPEDALEEAREASAGEYDYDTGSCEIDFNVEPAVEVAS